MSTEPQEKEKELDDGFDEIDRLGKKFFELADPYTKKQLIATMLGIGGETPEMTQYHLFESENREAHKKIEDDNTREHQEIYHELKIVKYGILALAGTFIGSEGVKQLLNLFAL